MDILETIFYKVVNVSEDKNPTVTPKTEAAYKAAYSAFIAPLIENPDTIKDGLEKEDVLVRAVTTQSEASFRAGFYTAVDLLIERGSK